MPTYDLFGHKFIANCAILVAGKVIQVPALYQSLDRDAFKVENFGNHLQFV